MIKVQVNVDREALSKCSVYVATPMYGGVAHGEFFVALFQLVERFREFGINATLGQIYSESLIPRARNRLAYIFLDQTDFTHLLFLDADIVFDPDDIIAMLALNRDIIAAPYAKKSFHWENIRQAAVKGMGANELEDVGANVNFNSYTKEINLFEPIKVREAATGMMLIKRGVFERMRAELPEIELQPYPSEAALGHGPSWAFFDTSIDPETKYYLSEDYDFCRKAEKLGIEVYFCPWMRTIHIGTQFYRCDMPKMAQWGIEINTCKVPIVMDLRKNGLRSTDYLPNQQPGPIQEGPQQERNLLTDGSERLSAGDASGNPGDRPQDPSLSCAVASQSE